MQSVCYGCPIVTKTGTHGKCLARIFNITFHENLFCSSWVITCRWMDQRWALKIECDGVDWIQVVHDNVLRLAVMNAIIPEL